MKPLTHPIVMTDFDWRRLRGLLRILRERSSVDVTNLNALEIELDRAQVVPPEYIPSNVVTMNSRVVLVDADDDHRTFVSLVFPDAPASEGSGVPVLSPLGLALLGCREGDEMVWPIRNGVRRIRLERVVYQPEALGHYLV